MKITCDVIRDLLPLAAEELASPDSMEVVREHLQGCEDCRRAYEDMKKPPVVVPEEPDLKTVRREIWKRRVLTALCAVLVVCTAGLWFLSEMTTPVYLSESVLAGVEPDEHGTVWVTLEAGRAGESTFQYEIQPMPDGTLITAWTNNWLRLKWNESVTRKVTVPITVTGNGIYYFSGDGGNDLLFYEAPGYHANGGAMSLPRLYLSFYFMVSLLVGAVALILAYVLRKRRAGKWLGMLGSFLCCYGVCQGIVSKLSFASFFAMQELGWALAMGTCLWGALMCLWGMRRRA